MGVMSPKEMTRAALMSPEGPKEREWSCTFIETELVALALTIVTTGKAGRNPSHLKMPNREPI